MHARHDSLFLPLPEFNQLRHLHVHVSRLGEAVLTGQARHFQGAWLCEHHKFMSNGPKKTSYPPTGFALHRQSTPSSSLFHLSVFNFQCEVLADWAGRYTTPPPR